MKNINMLIKPASGSCNMRCNYCFYHSLTNIREHKDYGIMSKETLEKLVFRAFEGDNQEITFAFQGGEPTLCGIEFYYQFEKYVLKYNKKNIKVNRAFQTNGILIDDKWCEYFNKYNYLLGLSLDGPKEINDLNRIDIKGNGTYKTIIKTKQLFEKYKVEYNILCVVNREVARHGKKVYQFFKDNNIRYIQFINCLDDLNSYQGTNKYSLTWERYLKFLKDTFDVWYEDVIKGDVYSIRQFDNYISMILGYAPESCNMNGFCSCQYVIEADGSVYPCDFYVIDQYKIGNVYENNLKEMFESNVTKQFISQSMVENVKCARCKWYKLCRNGCYRERKENLNEFCDAYYNFFNYAYERMVQIAKRYSK